MILTQIKELLDTMDWYFSFSDDYNVYKAGKAQENKLDSLISKLVDSDKVAYNAMVNKLVPKELVKQYRIKS